MEESFEDFFGRFFFRFITLNGITLNTFEGFVKALLSTLIFLIIQFYSRKSVHSNN